MLKKEQGATDPRLLMDISLDGGEDSKGSRFKKKGGRGREWSGVPWRLKIYEI
jgi:hypothetical protein